MGWKSIKWMATALILIVGLISILIFGLFSFMNSKESIEKRYFHESEKALQNSIWEFQDLFTNARRFAGKLTQMKEIQQAVTTSEPLRLRELFDLLQQTVPNSSGIKLGLDNGEVFTGLGPAVLPAGYDPRQQMWYRMGKAGGETVQWTEPYLDYLNQKVIITASRSVYSASGELIGVLAVDFDLAALSRYFTHSKIGSQGFIMLLNQSGTVVANTDNYWIGENVFGGELARVMAAASQDERTEYRIKGKSYYIKAGRLNESGMMIFTGVSKEEMNGDLWTLQLPLLIIGAVCLGVFGFAAYYFALRAIAPLVRLVELMKAAERGDYQVQANISGYAEITSLSHGFNLMMEGIRKRDEDLTASREKIARLAFYDSLTGVLNRRQAAHEIAKFIKKRPVSRIAFIYIDLDNFKTINDTMGHAAGDIVLVEAAKRFEAIPYANKSVARLGGDEFVIVLYEISSNAEIEDLVRQLVTSLAAPILYDKISYTIYSSIGIAVYPEHGAETEELLRKADMAMYRSKAKGKNQFSVFDTSIQNEIAAKAHIEHGIREALRLSEFELHYQPIYHPSAGRVRNLEALLRCRTARLSGVPILEIIQRAEESGLIIALDQWVLQSACEFAKTLNDGLAEPIRVSVNVSAKHIAQQDFVEHVKSAIDASGVNPEWLGLEITETVMMQAFDVAKTKLEELKKLHIHIYLDDFGTGYSSLNYLKSLPIDYVKIDKSFVNSMLSSDRDGRIMRTIVELSHNIGLQVIAEGVESEGQMPRLCQIDCDMLQGYHISKPVSGDQIRLIYGHGQ